MNTQKKYITAFLGLDLLRFILSICVVFRHYVHFYGIFKDNPVGPSQTHYTAEPLYNFLNPVYNYGQLAVQVFWLISGLIFYTIYHEEVNNKEISFGRFSYLRFTRLYPLHFLTLIVVAILNVFLFDIYGVYFAGVSDSWSSFFLQLFFIDAWRGGPDMLTFNAPAWSISIEVFVYIVFFLVTYVGATRGNRLTAMLVFIVIINFFNMLAPFNHCFMFFFFGCLLAKQIKRGIPLEKLLAGHGALTVAFVAVVWLLRGYINSDPAFYHADLIFDLRLTAISALLVLVFIYAFRSVKSSYLISLLKSLGNMTYSLYLVHFPVMITMILIMRPTDYHLFNNPAILGTFIGVSLIAGWVVFEYFEKPAQKFLRTRWDAYKAGEYKRKETGRQEISEQTSSMDLINRAG